MSEVIDEGAFQGRSAVEAKLAEAGADEVRRYSFSEAPEAAPDTGTPAEEVSADQPRNELGQFASDEQLQELATAASEDFPNEKEEDSVSVNGVDATDPAVAAFLRKYNGDVNKAIAGAVHLQRKAGEQSNELGDLRRMVDELSQLRETVQADYQQRQANQPLDQGTVDWFDEQLMQNPYGAIEYARQQGNNLLFQRGLAQWKEMQPYEAAVYTNNLNNAQLRQEVEQRVNAASQLPADANMHMALQNVRASHPEYVNYDDSIGETLAKYPYMQKAVENAYASGDREQLEGALETLYALAQRDTLANIALTGDAPETATTSAEVVAPTVSETHEPAPEPSPMDKWREEFRQTAERTQKGIWVAE